MDVSKEVERLKLLTSSENDELLTVLLEDSIDFVAAYTNRKNVPSELNSAVRDIAVIKFNRLGTEGESSRSEGGETHTFNDIPPNVRTLLDRYRLVRIGGKSFENPKK